MEELEKFSRLYRASAIRLCFINGMNLFFEFLLRLF
jgi:hypothetical protein